ncbi:MAG: hypothetical protein P1V13_15195 [Rhizobiaceae bacterium]|nr:hypothetical protein [Rhizobiaceae bacterium]|tara:strand:+ start:98172 stop:98636 length:465 start_codon:yes stop_codon:yes gene_type:complete
MTKSKDRTSDELSHSERKTLRCVVGHMIPLSLEFGVPGADDPDIFADILRSIDRDRDAIGEALRMIDTLAHGRLIDLPRTEQARCLLDFRNEHKTLAGVLEAAAARCYYRDDRVMASINMEARPPFPKGYLVEQGDWSLLDPVRARGRIFRDAN